MIIILGMAAISLLIAGLGLHSGNLFSMRGDGNITREDSPIQFWLHFVFWIGFAIFCITVALRSDGDNVATQQPAQAQAGVVMGQS